jgi:PHD/YefM family antitoxin component YafN of YafNO toxin-antitoxin module
MQAMTVHAKDITKDFVNTLVSLYHDANLVILSEPDYEKMRRAERNAEYLAKLDQAHADLEAGKGITLSMEQLEAMADA